MVICPVWPLKEAVMEVIWPFTLLPVVMAEARMLAMLERALARGCGAGWGAGELRSGRWEGEARRYRGLWGVTRAQGGGALTTRARTPPQLSLHC